MKSKKTRTTKIKNEIAYNSNCMVCLNQCKQFEFTTILKCPNYKKVAK